MMTSVLFQTSAGRFAWCCGGGRRDGTLNAVAKKLMHTDIPMGIMPLGTFNYVARALNIPLIWDWLEVIATGIEHRFMWPP